MNIINRLFVGASLPKQFKSPSFLQSSASILEQICLSVANFLTAMIVVGVSGMEALGIYSVVLVLANYIKSLFATLLHKQMVLAIAAKPIGTKKGVLMTTCGIQALFVVGLVITCCALGYIASLLTSWERIAWLIIGVAMYIASGTFFDLFRQYLYAIDAQTYSLKCTLSAVSLQAIGLILIAVLANSQTPVSWYFAVMAIGFSGAIAINQKCLSALRISNWHSWRYATTKLKSYWMHARFSLFGMSITWLQNQSVTPLLLVITSPLVVGYFSLARLMIMPLSVINQGLVNNSTPQLRRIAETKSPDAVTIRLRELSKTNMTISAVYVFILVFSHFSGLLHHYIPDYSNVQWFLVFWVISIVIIMQRFWISQFYVVHMRFKFLLCNSAAAALFTLIGMIVTGSTTETVFFPLLFYISGEILFIFLLLKGKRGFEI